MDGILEDWLERRSVAWHDGIWNLVRRLARETTIAKF